MNPHALKERKPVLNPKATELVQMETSGEPTWKTHALNPILIASLFVSFMYACWKTFLYILEHKG